jgi:hypothetical protein
MLKKNSLKEINEINKYLNSILFYFHIFVFRKNFKFLEKISFKLCLRFSLMVQIKGVEHPHFGSPGPGFCF